MALDLFWCASAALLWWGTAYTIWRALITPTPKFDEDTAPPVSILKPLCGADPGLFENLESFLKLDYPEYELILFVADPHDPALRVVQKLHRKHPRFRFRIVLSDTYVGPNPKVANLDRAWTVAKYDTVLVSDSNVRADRTYLREIIPFLGAKNPDVGIVTGFIYCFGATTFAGHLEEMTWNTFYARWVNIARSLGLGFVVGKSMLFKRSVAARFGGLSSFANHVAEDYMMGLAMTKIGKRVELRHRSIDQYVGHKTMRDYWARAFRWNLLQKYSAPVVFFATPLQFPVVLGLLTGHLYETAIVWFAADMLLVTALGGRPDPVTWVVSQLLAPLIWMHALTQSRVKWRGNWMRIGWRGWLKAR